MPSYQSPFSSWPRQLPGNIITVYDRRTTPRSSRSCASVTTCWRRTDALPMHEMKDCHSQTLRKTRAASSFAVWVVVRDFSTVVLVSFGWPCYPGKTSLMGRKIQRDAPWAPPPKGLQNVSKVSYLTEKRNEMLCQTRPK